MTVAALAAALGVGACGGEDDFKNEDRPAAPIEISARVSDEEVSISPSKPPTVGGGLATITISNQSQDPVTLTLAGPTDEASNPIPPGGVGSMKAELAEGEYEVTGGEESNAREDLLVVGPQPGHAPMVRPRAAGADPADWRFRGGGSPTESRASVGGVERGAAPTARARPRRKVAAAATVRVSTPSCARRGVTCTLTVRARGRASEDR